VLTLLAMQITCPVNGSGRLWLQQALIDSMLMICTTLRGCPGCKKKKEGADIREPSKMSRACDIQEVEVQSCRALKMQRDVQLPDSCTDLCTASKATGLSGMQTWLWPAAAPKDQLSTAPSISCQHKSEGALSRPMCLCETRTAE